MVQIQRPVETSKFTAEKRGWACLRHRAAHSHSETLTFNAMNNVHALQSWSAEMMAPARWCGSKGQWRFSSSQWRNASWKKGDHAGVCGAILPVWHEKQQLWLFLMSIWRRRWLHPQISFWVFRIFNNLASSSCSQQLQPKEFEGRPGQRLWHHFTSSTWKAATRAFLRRNSTGEMTTSSAFSSSIQCFQQPSKFGHLLNNCDGNSLKGDQAGICGAISPVGLELFLDVIRRGRWRHPQLSVQAFDTFSELASLVKFSTIAMETLRSEIRTAFVVPFH
jgi:hypothetical protein